MNRLGEAYDEDYSTDEESLSHRSGRVNVANPRTPGGRLNRSMDVDRNFMFETHPETLRRLGGESTAPAGVARAGLGLGVDTGRGG